jgi:hypothetical protein
MGDGARADGATMTSTTHEVDVLAPSRLRRALADPRLRSRTTVGPALAPLTAFGVLVVLIDGHGLLWLAGLVAGAWLAGLVGGIWAVGWRFSPPASAPVTVDHGDRDVRELVGRLADDGWGAIHDLDGRHARYRHVAVGPGGVILLHSQRLAHPWRPDDPLWQREMLVQRRRALSAAANLRHEIGQATGQPTWVQPVVVVWSEFAPGCLQDGRCVFVSGPRLIDWMRRRPGQLSPARAATVRTALERLAAGCPASATPVAA